MRADIFLDTNVLLYAASSQESEKTKKTRARELLELSGVGLSVQVLAEFYVNATSKLKIPEEKVLKALNALDSYPILPINAQVFWSALSIRSRYKISYWDSAIIAAAVELGCHTLFSEDLDHGQTYAGVQVMNPFLT